MKAETVLAPRRFDHFVLDEADARLTRAGKPVPIAPKPFAVLCALARIPGRLLTKHELLDLVWGHRFVTNASLKSAISELRAALDDDPKQPRYIATVSRRGYRFIAAPAAEPEATHDRPQSGLAALTALCRADASLAELIRTVAATL
jgi:DNA-binding winged helix-turn-helix (wHTH) protein